MGTNRRNVEEYLNLWEKFEKLLEKENLNLSSFSKKWERYHDSNEENDYKKFYGKLKRMRQRAMEKKAEQMKTRTVRHSTYTNLEEYISFINDDYLKIELFEDEKLGHWFED